MNINHQSSWKWHSLEGLSRSFTVALFSLCEPPQKAQNGSCSSLKCFSHLGLFAGSIWGARNNCSHRFSSRAPESSLKLQPTLGWCWGRCVEGNYGSGGSSSSRPGKTERVAAAIVSGQLWKCDALHLLISSIWWFPKMGIPPNHPF